MATISYSIETEEKILELVENSYAIEDIHDFISEHSESDFLKYYEEYVELGESYDYAAVDEYIQEIGIDYLDSFTDSYRGQYSNFEEYAEEFFNDNYAHEIPDPLRFYIDIEAFAHDLKYDYTVTDSGFVFMNC